VYSTSIPGSALAQLQPGKIESHGFSIAGKVPEFIQSNERKKKLQNTAHDPS
jgi:hypothetical protein